MFKTCSKCKTEKSIDSFHNNKRSKDGKQHRCKPCAKAFTQEATKTWRNSSENYKFSVMKTKVKLKYGLDLDTIQKIYEAQNGCCAICKRELLYGADKCDTPHIDHNHKTGTVRGLLCLQCNTGLGMFDDSIALLDQAKSYLGQADQRERLSELASKDDAIVRSHENKNHEKLAEMTSSVIH